MEKVDQNSGFPVARLRRKMFVFSEGMEAMSVFIRSIAQSKLGGFISFTAISLLCSMVTAQDFTYTASSPAVLYDPSNGEAAFSVIVTIDEDVAPGTDPFAVQGLSFDLAHDGTVLTVLDVIFSPALQALNGGDGPAFFLANLAPADGDGIVMGCIFVSLRPFSASRLPIPPRR